MSDTAWSHDSLFAVKLNMSVWRKRRMLVLLNPAVALKFLSLYYEAKNKEFWYKDIINSTILTQCAKRKNRSSVLVTIFL